MATSGQGVLRRMLMVFEFGVDTSQVEKGKAKLGNLLGDMKKVAAGLAGGMIASGIKNFVKDTVDEMMQIRRGAAELRITTDEMQGLQIAAKATGSDAKWLAMSMERLQVNVERAGRGAKNQATAMNLLGLKAHDSNGKVKSATELYLETADALSKMTDQNKQAIVVRDLFGIGGHRQLPILRMGRKAIEDLMNITKEYGRYEKEVIEQSAHYTVTMLKLQSVFRGIKSYVMSQWIPILEKQTEGLIKAGKWMMTMMKNSLLAKAAMQLLQVAIGALALKMALAYPWATALIAAFTALTLLWDDILVLFDGGHSLIGDVVDKLFGKGSSTAMVEKLRDLYRDLSTTIEGILVMLGMKPEQSETNVSHAPGGGAAAPTVGATDVTVDRGWTRNLRLLNKPPEVRNVPGGSEVSRGFLDRFLDPDGKNVHFGSTPVLDTQSRPDDSPNMSVDVGGVTVQMTQPEGADAQSFGTAAGKAASAEIQRHLKAAAASIRREKQTGGE